MEEKALIMEQKPAAATTTIATTAPKVLQQQQQQMTSPLPEVVLSPYAGVMPAPPPPSAYHTRYTVRRLKFRHWTFQLGFAGLLLSTVLFIIGFSAPAWACQAGLWLTCLKTYEGCRNNNGEGPRWLDATRGMEILALVCIIFSVAVELYQDVFKSPPPKDNKAVEILGVAAGIFGLFGVTLFGVKVTDLQMWKLDTGRHSVGDDYPKQYQMGFHTYDLNWGFGLAAAGLCLCILSSVLIAFSRAKHGPRTNRALASLGVCTTAAPPQAVAAPQAVPTQPAMPGYGYAAPTYPCSYACSNPCSYSCSYPPAPAMMAGAPAVMPAAPAAAGMPMPQCVLPAQGMQSAWSQVPACFVTVQGQMVPVCREATAPTTNPSAAPTVAANGTVKQNDAQADGQPSVKL